MAAPSGSPSPAMDNDDDFPSELRDRLSEFDDSLSKMEETLNLLHTQPLNELQSKLTPLEKAKVDLLGVYAINSLFWMYLTTKGENPKEHGVKLELDRIRSYMARVKEIQDKELAPKINKEATKKFVRSALWQAAHSKSDNKRPAESASSDTAVVTSSKRGKKSKT